MPVRFERLKQKTTPETVALVLKEAILSGELVQGGQLREVGIATEMGISRAPLREALAKLEEEGLVVRIPFRGRFVAEASAKAVQEIVSLRIRLEPFAVERALPALLGPASGRLDEENRKLEAAVRTGDVMSSVEAHMSLHRLFYELADHAWLLRHWTEWELQLRLYLAADHAAFGHLERIRRDHIKLAEVIRTGDLTAITEELIEHIEHGVDHGIDPDNASGQADGATARLPVQTAS